MASNKFTRLNLSLALSLLIFHHVRVSVSNKNYKIMLQNEFHIINNDKLLSMMDQLPLNIQEMISCIAYDCAWIILDISEDDFLFITFIFVNIYVYIFYKFIDLNMLLCGYSLVSRVNKPLGSCYPK
jgi:hypothetical protein